MSLLKSSIYFISMSALLATSYIAHANPIQLRVCTYHKSYTHSFAIEYCYKSAGVANNFALRAANGCSDYAFVNYPAHAHGYIRQFLYSGTPGILVDRIHENDTKCTNTRVAFDSSCSKFGWKTDWPYPTRPTGKRCMTYNPIKGKATNLPSPPSGSNRYIISLTLSRSGNQYMISCSGHWDKTTINESRKSIINLQKRQSIGEKNICSN